MNYLHLTKLLEMRSIFDQDTREVIINRIHTISNDHKAQWGKMNAYQMLKHCSLCDDMFQGRLRIKRVFIGRLIGPLALKKALKDDKPFGKNSPTSPFLVTISESGDLALQKQEWINKLQQYQDYHMDNYIHPFFGPMSNEQVGIFVYKHIDHHLRQFAV